MDIGDKVKVVADFSGHCFRIGELVTFDGIEDGIASFTNINGIKQWLHPNDYLKDE
jgi:hypothetical protein